MTMTNFSIWFEHDILKQILAVWQKTKQEAYLVGGAVRDGLLGQLAPDADLDLLVPRDALSVSRQLADALDAAFYPVDAERGVGRVVFADRRYLDIAEFRAPTLAADLRDRDFTINAIALKLDVISPQLIDVVGGMDDLRAKIIRVASDEAIQNDPIRAVRAIRLAQTLGFKIEPHTGAKLPAAVAGLKRISAERLRDELLKCWHAPTPGTATDMLREYGLLAEILPEVLPMVGVQQSPPHHLSVWEHSLRVMDNCRHLPLDMPDLGEFQAALDTYFQTKLPGVLTRANLMPLAALLHDAGKPHTKSVDADGRIRFFNHERVSAEIADTVLRRLRFSDAARKFVMTVVRHHMRPILLANEPVVSKRAIYRFSVAAGDAAPAVAIFSLCDYRAIAAQWQGDEQFLRAVAVAQRILARYFSPKPPRLLSGAEIIAALGISEGREVGEWLRRLDEAQAIGELSTKEEALAFLRR